ncbi:hypothetical protein [Domibacillus mangrovi]|uniref:Uncharacterized protein n=1 Tax=Domibacillus mangrovi TaxID=1714354 RepID=A0A1Q5P365_9BACI|nr:hypothetical protein [Domibacillus mangrovi]OKL36687.1 hypothetical protein BLL40_08085 [Domibacillus mangrovi]
MDVKNTVWACVECGDQGTLYTLIQLMEQDNVSKRILQNSKIYNPKEEIVLIRSRFEHLISKHGSSVEKLYKKVNQLIEYYQIERRPH